MKNLRIAMAAILQLVAAGLLLLTFAADTLLYIRLVLGWNAVLFFALGFLLINRPKLLIRFVEWLPLS